MAVLNVHPRLYPLGFHEILQSVVFVGLRITNNIKNLSRALQALIKKVVNFFKQFPDFFQARPLPPPKDLPLISPKGRTIVAPNCSKWKPRKIVVEKAITKMFKNMCKAVKEHVDKAKEVEVNAYAPFPIAVPSLGAINQRLLASKLSYKISHESDQGGRSEMEDDSFFVDSPNYFLAGVFDGHGGKNVAEFASQEFQARFSQTLLESQGNIHRAFEKLFEDIQQSINQHPQWGVIGSTAVISYIDKATNFIYTATLGDSEAKIYRKLGDGFKSIPISVVRDWGSEKEAARAAIGLEDPKIYDAFLERENPRKNRVNRLNVSRALGDTMRAGTKEKPLFIHKPKITLNILQTDDIVLWACDGLWESVYENEIVDLLSREEQNPNIARMLVHYSVKIKKGGDNVSVIALRTCSKSF